MKKTLIVLAVLGVLAVSLGSAGSAYAQTVTPPQSGGGLLHTYMVAALAEALGLSAAEINSRLAAGESAYQIALAQGFSAEEIPALLQAAHSKAIRQAAADGILTQAQAQWMTQRQSQMRGYGMGAGSGACNGAGAPIGMGMRRGGRWAGQPNTP